MAAEVAFKALTRRRYMSYASFCSEWDSTAKDVDESLVGHYPSRAQYYRYFGKTKTMPRLDARRVLEHMFGIPVQQLLHATEDIEQESAASSLGIVPKNSSNATQVADHKSAAESPVTAVYPKQGRRLIEALDVIGSNNLGGIADSLGDLVNHYAQTICMVPPAEVYGEPGLSETTIRYLGQPGIRRNR
jgi:hypothetical protein